VTPMRRRIALMLATLILLAGCNAGKSEPPKSDPPPATTPVEQPAPTQQEPEPEGDPASLSLLPVPERPYMYGLTDGTNANEWYIREGERLVGAYNGKPYVTWFVLPQGIYRIDPKGKTLLRYLPRELKDGLAWKQQSGDAEVWFSLRSVDMETVTGTPASHWELTVLNRGERTLFRFLPGEGITFVNAENLAKPADSFVKSHVFGSQPVTVPKEEMLAAAATRPAGELPPVTEVSAAEYEEALRSLLAQHGVTVTEIDLDGDGSKERIEAALDKWSPISARLYNSHGQEIQYAFHGQLPPGTLNRVAIVTIPGIKVPTVVYEASREPEGWHHITFKWYTGQGLSEANGWAPKISSAYGSAYRIESDGRIAILAPSAQMGGYKWTRWFTLGPSTDQWNAFTATLAGEELTAGPYPTEPAALLTATMIAHWYKQDADLSRFVPDATVRAKIEAAKIRVPMYYPSEARLGSLSYKPNPHGADPWVEIAPAPLGEDGSIGFLISSQEYEGGSYWAGRVTFGTAEDGRLIVTDFAVEKAGWNY